MPSQVPIAPLAIMARIKGNHCQNERTKCQGSKMITAQLPESNEDRLSLRGFQQNGCECLHCVNARALKSVYLRDGALS